MTNNSLQFSATTSSYTGNYYTNILTVRGNKGGWGYDITGSVTFTDGIQTKTASLTQYGTPYLKRFAGDEYVSGIEIPQAGGEALFHVRSHYDLRFTFPSWVSVYLDGSTVVSNARITAPYSESDVIARGTDTKVLRLVVGPNTTGAERTGDLVMRHYSGSTLLSTDSVSKTITQTGEVTENVSVTPSTIYLPKTGGTGEFYVSAEGSWTITGKPSWLTLSRTGGTGAMTVTATAGATTSSTGRSVLLTVATSNSETYAGVSQNGDDELRFTFAGSGTLWFWENGDAPRTIQYSKNNGAWTDVTSSTVGTEIADVVAGDVIRVRGNNMTYARDNQNYSYFKGTAPYTLGGYLTSLIDPANYKEVYELEDGWNFFALFHDDKFITSAADLKMPSTRLAPYCYREMFKGCSDLTAAPSFPVGMAGDKYVLTLATGCCMGMFQDCVSLTSVPGLYVDTLVSTCFRDMYNGCSEVNRIVCMATNPDTNYTYNWLAGTQFQGSFVCKRIAAWPSGDSGIPQGWEIEEVD